jgi:hypothetical protein
VRHGVVSFPDEAGPVNPDDYPTWLFATRMRALTGFTHRLVVELMVAIPALMLFLP